MKSIGKTLPVAVLLALFFAYSSAAGDGVGYRLSGIMGADPGQAFAVIENSSGEQRLVKEGGAIGQGFVKTISSRDKTVVLSFPEQEVTLRLTGSGMNDETQITRDREQSYSISDFTENSEQAELGTDDVSNLLALVKSAPKFEESQLAVKVNQLLGLREDTQIVAYNDEAVPSIHAVLEEVGTKISKTGEYGNFLGTISVSDATGRRRIYLMTRPVAD